MPSSSSSRETKKFSIRRWGYHLFLWIGTVRGFSRPAFSPHRRYHYESIHKELMSLHASGGRNHYDHKYNLKEIDVDDHDDSGERSWWKKDAVPTFLATIGLALTLVTTSIVVPSAALADSTAKYDGFAEYAKENKMEQSDVKCFIEQCGDETQALFRNPRGIKGVSCLGRCKGEQSCATRCFAEFGSEALNNWLSCTIEEHECVKVPRQNLDNSAEEIGYPYVVPKFDPSSLLGTWYKTDGLNPNYDLFDCQTNIFTPARDQQQKGELDMQILFRVRRPVELGGGFWENQLTERMIPDGSTTTTTTTTETPTTTTTTTTPEQRKSTLHTQGKMYGLQFSENWYILGESNGQDGIPPFKLVAYRGHTLQGNYEGAFVYAKEPKLPEAAKAAVAEAAIRGGLDFSQFTPIDNTCPAGEKSLNDDLAGTGTSATDWIDLVIGEGGVIDWISPGWRGEYKQ